jgi:hypothetical protein
MKLRRIQITLMTVLFFSLTVFAQTNMKNYTAGHTFEVSIPDYMTKTTGLNDAATFQFNNSVKDIAGFIIFDTKEELEIAGLKYTNAQEFYESFIKDFLAKEKNRKISEPKIQTIGDINIVECDASFYSKESKTEIYYFVGVVETKKAFYKLLCLGGIDSKEKYKADFQKILYSIKD